MEQTFLKHLTNNIGLINRHVIVTPIMLNKRPFTHGIYDLYYYYHDVIKTHIINKQDKNVNTIFGMYNISEYTDRIVSDDIVPSRVKLVRNDKNDEFIAMVYAKDDNSNILYNHLIEEKMHFSNLYYIDYTENNFDIIDKI